MQKVDLRTDSFATGIAETAWREDADDVAQPSVLVLLGWLMVHAALGVAMARSPVVATGHVLCTIVVGFWWSNLGRHAGRLCCLMAYIAGCEVLWRMTGAVFFWEGCKYCIAGLALWGVLVQRRGVSLLPLLYLFLLIPSFGCLDAADWNEVRFNLSGPLALCCAALYLDGLCISLLRMSTVLMAFLTGPVAILTISILKIVETERITWGLNSSKVASGGFGPNQVSAVLGLGALVAFLWAQTTPLAFRLRLLLYGLLGVLLAQTALTFSRGGVYAAVLAAFCGLAASISKPGAGRMRYAVLGVTLVLSFVAYAVVIPALDAFTKGGLTARFAKEGVTGRERIAMADMDLFLAHPLLGVGPGESKELRAESHSGLEYAAHTEYTRVLAEHGMAGALSLATLLLMLFRGVARKGTFWPRLVAASLAAWALLFLAVNAFRLALPGVAIALALTELGEETGQPPTASSSSRTVHKGLSA